MTKISTHYDGCEASHPECKKALGLQTSASGDTSRGPTQQGATHTPGPWEVSKSGMVTNEGQVAVLAPDKELGKRRVALVDLQRADVKARERWQVDDLEREANARLIKESPALLAAAKAFIAWVDDVWGSAALSPKTLQDYENAKAAILAAEGSDRP